MVSLKVMANWSIKMEVFLSASSAKARSMDEVIGLFRSQRSEKLKAKSSKFSKQKSYHNKRRRSTRAILIMESFVAMGKRHGALVLNTRANSWTVCDMGAVGCFREMARFMKVTGERVLPAVTAFSTSLMATNTTAFSKTIWWSTG